MGTNDSYVKPQPPPYPCPGWSGATDDDEWVWVRADSDWRAGGLGRRCRSRGCTSPAELRLNRWQMTRRRGRVPMWWHYCAEHSYSRVVHDGVVWQPGRSEEWFERLRERVTTDA